MRLFLQALLQTLTQSYAPSLDSLSDEVDHSMDISDISLGDQPHTPLPLYASTPTSSGTPSFSSVFSQGHSNSSVSLDPVEEAIEPMEEVEQSVSSPLPPWYGFKLIGDNIDKNVKPRHQTMEHRGSSLHYFNCYAVLDRVNLSDHSGEPINYLFFFQYLNIACIIQY